MNLIGLVRVTHDVRNVAVQHEAMDPICARVFEEPHSRKRLLKSRPELQVALNYLSPGDMLVVAKVGNLGQSTIDGLEVLNELFDLGVQVKVLEGMAAGEHTERSAVLDLGRDIAELRRDILSSRIKAGVKASRELGVSSGRPRVINASTRAAILARREQGEPLRSIAQAVGVSVGTVHNVLVR